MDDDTKLLVEKYKLIVERVNVSFKLDNNGQYRWAGPVNPQNVTVQVNKSKYSEVAKAAAQFAGERLFVDKPITIKIVWDNSLGSLHGAFGASSTSSDGSVTQAYISPKRAGEYGARGIADTVIHELVHTWQHRNPHWGAVDYSLKHHERPEEKHGEDLTQLLANEFAMTQGQKFGIEASPWLNTPKYFETIVNRLHANNETPQYQQKGTI